MMLPLKYFQIRPMFPIVQHIGEKMLDYLAADFKGAKTKTIFTEDVSKIEHILHIFITLQQNTRRSL